MKKITAVLMVLLLFSNTALAYEFPHSFWAPNSKYVEALNAKDNQNIIKYGNQLIDIMIDEPECQEKKDVLVSRYTNVGTSYAELGDYDNSAVVFEKLYNFTKNYGNEFYDFVKVCKAKANQYKSEIALYTEGGTPTYYGAKNEKENGVLFGLVAGSETREMLDNESFLLIYQELGQDLDPYNTRIVKQASEEGQAVEFALNCPKEGEDIESIYSKESYLKQISDMLKQYPNVPVYLRFAAEFDIWGRKTTPEALKTAFRFVADYFHQRNSNVAMVWSPNQVAEWQDNIEEYYPGDEYVDWVGMSLYAIKYFLADKNQPDEYQVVFQTGRNSNPVIAVKNIIEKFGDRKPIMISECGCGHTLLENKMPVEYTSEFGITRLKQYLAYLPMVYPQIKAIAYFDWYVDWSDEKYDFRLTTNSEMKKAFVNMTKGGRFIQDKYENNADLIYKKVENGSWVNNIFPISCYAHKYDTNVKSVAYYLNDKYVGMSNEVPFTTYIDGNGFEGETKLKAVAQFENGATLTKETVININKASENINVEINDKKITFDTNPVLYNDRTMVPLRKIFEELGAQVTWDEATQTATGKKGSTEVKVTIGSKKMYVSGKEIVLDTSPIILTGRTLVPARAIAEGLGCKVEWIDGTQTVVITQ